ncbi:erythropoietin receptor [Pelobates cultripes]|uniref:Erythropoietin receptor n=2 Tax=Pelobates cultripes TaxID=61616 RepID=A0AAD1RLT1_PELCU|nr:erythropoietin receptor [Pelobates cultripes]
MTQASSADTWWHICNFPMSDVNSFTPIDIGVSKSDNSSKVMYRKTVYTDQVVFLEPPRNVTVKETNTPRVYMVFWEPPIMSFEDSITYQVRCTPTNDDEQMNEGDGITGQNNFLLTPLNANTRYSIRVRAKMNGYSYNGYWSEWTQPIVVQTGFDPLYIVLCVAVALLMVIIPLFLLLKYISIIKHKIWPQVPTPESHFQDLFTIHKGNFQLWLGQADFYLMWFSRHIFYEAPYSALEVLSELPSAPMPQCPAIQLPSKDNYVILNDNIMPQLPAMVNGRWQPFSWTEPPGRESIVFNPEPEETTKRKNGLVGFGWLETQSTETNHTDSGVGEASTIEKSQEETFKCENDMIKGPKIESDWLKMSFVDNYCPEEGKQSPASSFEYTIVETCDGLLSPKPRPLPPSPPSLKYAYLLMSDSGEESRPPSPNLYQNNQFLPPLYSQC